MQRIRGLLLRNFCELRFLEVELMSQSAKYMLMSF
jgi:hypothetical protein